MDTTKATERKLSELARRVKAIRSNDTLEKKLIQLHAVLKELVDALHQERRG